VRRVYAAEREVAIRWQGALASKSQSFEGGRDQALAGRGAKEAAARGEDPHCQETGGVFANADEALLRCAALRTDQALAH